MPARLLLPAAALAFATPAFAHPGGHQDMSFTELIVHYAEPDHLAFLAATVIVGVLAYRWGRAIEAKAHARATRQKDDRS